MHRYIHAYIRTYVHTYIHMTPYTNPWNEIYRLAAGKRKRTTQITTLRKPDGSLTTDLHNTLSHMLEYFAPEDNQKDDTEFHRQARILSQDPIDTDDDKEFTVDEIRNAVDSMEDKKGTRGRRDNWRNLQMHFRNFTPTT